MAVVRSRIVTFRVDEELFAGMQRLTERDGIPVSEQVRRALRMWLEAKKIHVKAPRRRRTLRLKV